MRTLVCTRARRPLGRQPTGPRSCNHGRTNTPVRSTHRRTTDDKPRLRDFQRLQVKAKGILEACKGEAVGWTIGTMHDLRKTYATRLARRIPMHDLRRLLGHASITTTAEYYTEASDDVVEAVRLAFAG